MARRDSTFTLRLPRTGWSVADTPVLVTIRSAGTDVAGPSGSNAVTTHYLQLSVGNTVLGASRPFFLDPQGSVEAQLFAYLDALVEAIGRAKLDRKQHAVSIVINGTVKVRV